MKRFLTTLAILAFSAGVAAGDVSLSGDARMGIISGFENGFTPVDESDVVFTSRARVVFTLSGASDSGLTFGASFRADNAGGASSGTAGTVFVVGAFGKLTIGEIDSAAKQAVGNVDGVGLTGLGDLNNAVYVHDFVETVASLGGFESQDPSASYEYSSGAFTGILSITNPGTAFIAAGGDDVLALGLKYAASGYSVALGYETWDVTSSISLDQVTLGVGANLGALSLKANYAKQSVGAGRRHQYHVSATYTADALSLTAFVATEDDNASTSPDVDWVTPGPQPLGRSGYGIGASYDLGGDAKVVGGYVMDETIGASAFDLGLAFLF